MNGDGRKPATQADLTQRGHHLDRKSSDVHLDPAAGFVKLRARLDAFEDSLLKDLARHGGRILRAIKKISRKWERAERISALQEVRILAGPRTPHARYKKRPAALEKKS